MTRYSGSGDPRRSIELLWGLSKQPSPARGPRAGLDVATVVEAAIAIADESGFDAVSMRSVAERLGRSTMSLYTYVPGKAELLDVMHDTVLGELPTQRWRDTSWRTALERSARDLWALFERHPWMVQISPTRASLGPHSLDTFEAQARLLDGLGLTGVEVSRLAGAIAIFVQGSARVVAEARGAAQETGLTDDEWWNERMPVFQELTAGVDWSARYPTISRLDSERAFDQLDRATDDTTSYLEREALDSFELGLRCLLDGIAALIDARREIRSARPRDVRGR